MFFYGYYDYITINQKFRNLTLIPCNIFILTSSSAFESFLAFYRSHMVRILQQHANPSLTSPPHKTHVVK